jgi:hypothetical protein
LEIKSMFESKRYLERRGRLWRLLKKTWWKTMGV